MICCFRDEAKLNVHGYPNATHQSFPTRAQAEAYIKGATIPIASTRAEPYSSRNRVNKVNKGQKDNTPLTPVQTQVRELVLDKINCDPEDHKRSARYTQMVLLEETGEPMLEQALVSIMEIMTSVM